MRRRGVHTMTLGNLWDHFRATPTSTSKRLSRPPRNLRVGRRLKTVSFILSTVMQQALRTKRGTSFCSARSSRIFILIILRDLDRRVRSQQLSQHPTKRLHQRKTSMSATKQASHILSLSWRGQLQSTDPVSNARALQSRWYSWVGTANCRHPR